MVCLLKALKKPITTDFLHIALFLTLLHGEFLYYNNQAARHSIDRYLRTLDQYNGTREGGGSDGVTLSAPSFNDGFNNLRNYFDPPINLIPTSKGFEDLQEYISSQINNRTGNVEDEFDYLRIIEELQRITSLPPPAAPIDAVIGKGSPSFQDITAYLISNTTNSALPSNLGSTVPTLPAGGSSSGSDYGGFQPLSVISDNGRVEILGANQPSHEVEALPDQIDGEDSQHSGSLQIVLTNNTDEVSTNVVKSNAEENEAVVQARNEPDLELDTPFDYSDPTFSFFDTAVSQTIDRFTLLSHNNDNTTDFKPAT